MKRLWVAAALAPLSFAAANAANAQTCTGTPIVCTISNSSGTAVTTGTVNSGSPANIALTGTIAPTSTSTAAAAITVNSSNTVSNSGGSAIPAWPAPRRPSAYWSTLASPP